MNIYAVMVTLEAPRSPKPKELDPYHYRNEDYPEYEIVEAHV